VITILGGTPITVLASSTYTDLGATANDDVDGDITANIVVTGSVDTEVLGQHTITYTVSDSASNTSTAIRDVFVVEATTTDNILPVIFITGGTPITILEGGVYTELGATATDDVDGDITANIVVTGSVNTNTVGVYTITYTVSDTALNTATAFRTVNVIANGPDITPPTITVINGSPITIAQNSTYVDPGATATDNRDGDITSRIVVTGLPIDTSATGTYTVTYTVSDNALNTSSTSRQVIVVEDNVAPIVTILGSNPVNIVQTLTYTDAGAIAIDNIEGDVTANIVVTGLPINTSATGTYEIIYTVSDSTGNTASSTRIVNVIPDSIAPVITILGTNPTYLTVGDSYTDAGATAVDNVDGVVSVVTFSNNVNTSLVGTYSVVYNATDTASNIATATRVVQVNPVDTIPPVITILGSNPVTVVMGSSYTDAGATANDAVDGSVTDDIVVTGLPLNTSATGTFSIIYTVADRVGNANTTSRTVNIVQFADTILPVITILGVNPVNLTVGGSYTDAGATAVDNVDGDMTSHIATVNNVNTSVVGSYTVRYIVTDGALNTASSTRIVIVNEIVEEEEEEEVVRRNRGGSTRRRVANTATTTATTTPSVSTSTQSIIVGQTSSTSTVGVNTNIILPVNKNILNTKVEEKVEDILENPTEEEGSENIDDERGIFSALTASVLDAFSSFINFVKTSLFVKYYVSLAIFLAVLGGGYYFFVFRKEL